MDAAPKCSKCGGDMEEGLMLDHGYSQKYATSWVAGRPEQGFFGPRVWGKEQHPIRAFCCLKCGYLEAYASRE